MEVRADESFLFLKVCSPYGNFKKNILSFSKDHKQIILYSKLIDRSKKNQDQIEPGDIITLEALFFKQSYIQGCQTFGALPYFKSDHIVFLYRFLEIISMNKNTLFIFHVANKTKSL